MEEPKSAQSTPTTQVPNAPSSAQTLPPQPPHSLPSKPRKRPLDNDARIRNSNCFKIRAFLRDLRPHFLELCLPIIAELKLLVELYKTAETIAIGKCRNTVENHSLPGERPHDVITDQAKPDNLFGKPSDNKFSSTGAEKLKAEDGQGSYIIGGSAFGWNFITYDGKEPVYYGVTKESFQAASTGSEKLRAEDVQGPGHMLLEDLLLAGTSTPLMARNLITAELQRSCFDQVKRNRVCKHSLEETISNGIKGLEPVGLRPFFSLSGQPSSDWYQSLYGLPVGSMATEGGNHQADADERDLGQLRGAVTNIEQRLDNFLQEFRALVATMGHNPPLRIHTTGVRREIPPPQPVEPPVYRPHDAPQRLVVITTIAMNPISRCF
ncbi:hypothetical protein FNV43_RR15242 [Rhamnella rubrinervis]|uniref:Uncharacterized protein n=1 Tax=Rhamnella rubrinervis TaxID=2594499 RepID=A0A8K0GXA8_9ROSA|nr:hypothetical protein FNV43_RR15242 [Rhamnella rubrinervis]